MGGCVISNDLGDIEEHICKSKSCILFLLKRHFIFQHVDRPSPYPCCHAAGKPASRMAVWLSLASQRLFDAHRIVCVR